jgi:hypothetical protein
MDAEHFKDLIDDPECDYEVFAAWCLVYFIGEWAVGIWFGVVLAVALLMWQDAESW